MVRDLSWQPNRAVMHRQPWKTKRRLPRLVAGVVVLAGIVAAGMGISRWESPVAPSDFPTQALPSAWTPVAALSTDQLDPLLGIRTPGVLQRRERTRLRPGEAPAAALGRMGLDRDDVNDVTHHLQKVTDLRRMRADAPITIEWDVGGPINVVVAEGALLEHRVERREGAWSSRRVDIPVTTEVAAVSGTVRSSLWQAVIDAGGNANLVDALVEMFAWDIDFFQDVRPGDRFRVITKKRFARGRFLGYGDVDAAEFSAAGEVHRAFAHRRGDVVSYYDDEGRSTRKQLLRTPVRYGHVTSRFGRRRHPVLGYTRAHNGIDYGVGTGTPIWSVGDGRVVRAGWVGGFGKLVEVKHPNGWLSQYAHLSRILVRRGQRVSQKQRVGLSGSTGLASGPHLHFGLKRHGKYVNPHRQRFNRGTALRGQTLVAFKARVEALAAALDQVQVAQQGTVQPQEG